MFGSIYSAMLLLVVFLAFGQAFSLSIEERSADLLMHDIRSFGNAIALHHRSFPHDDLDEWVQNPTTGLAACTPDWAELSAERRALLAPPQNRVYSREIEMARASRTPYDTAYSFWGNGCDEVVQLRFNVRGRDRAARLLNFMLTTRPTETEPLLSHTDADDQEYNFRINLQPGMQNILRRWQMENRMVSGIDKDKTNIGEAINNALGAPLRFGKKVIGADKLSIGTDCSSATAHGGIGGIVLTKGGYALYCGEDTSVSPPERKWTPLSQHRFGAGVPQKPLPIADLEVEATKIADAFASGTLGGKNCFPTNTFKQVIEACNSGTLGRKFCYDPSGNGGYGGSNGQITWVACP